MDKNEQLIHDLKQTVEFMKTHRWTRGSFAKRRSFDSRGLTTCDPHALGADSFCLLGAACRVTGLNSSEPRIVAINHAVWNETTFFAPSYNDYVARDKRYVIRLLNKIIKKKSMHNT